MTAKAFFNLVREIARVDKLLGEKTNPGLPLQ